MAGLLAIPMLCLVILIHELGHALGAVASGMRVDELIIGFGPLVKRCWMKGLPVTLRAIPVGGGLSIADDDYRNASVARKRISLLAGPAASILGGWVLCAAGKFIATAGEASFWVRFVDSVAYAVGLVRVLVGASLAAFAEAATGATVEYMGPIGLAGWMNSLGPMELPLWLVLAGVVSVGGGLFNLLPVPPLDGGRALVVAAEKKLGASRMARLERFGMALVIAFGAVVALGDLLRIAFSAGCGQ